MTLLMSSAKSNFTPEFGSVFFLIDECCCINFPCIQNESVTLISDVCAEGERVLNALKSFRVYQAWQDLVVVQSTNKKKS